MTQVVLLKAHNKGYTRKDGTYVSPFDDKRANAKPEVKPTGKPAHGNEYHWQWHAGAMIKVPGPAPDGSTKPATTFGGKPIGAPPKKSLWSDWKDKTQDMFSAGQQPHSQPKKPVVYPAYHPKMNEDNKPHGIMHPSKASDPSTWTDPESTAVFLPGGDHPTTLNGVDFAVWKDAPRTEDGWKRVKGQDRSITEPELPDAAESKLALGSGVIVMEPDGRVWLIDPSNAFGGYKSTFPKGKLDHGLHPQANAIKECFEESGLQVEITGYLGDFKRTTSITRYYLARRVGGTPIDCGWESQSVRLVPKDELLATLNRENDQEIAKKIDGVKTGHVTDDGIESTKGWTKVSGQQGSNSGGTFKDNSGRDWYCKFPNKHAHSPELVKNELLANKLYHAAGIDVPDCKLVQYKGKLGIASRIIPGLTVNQSKLKPTTPGVADGFAVDCWLANWDSVGLVYDNMLVSNDGHAVRIDQGGSLLYRAQGAPKGAAFGDKVTETKTLRDGSNAQAAAVFSKLTPKQIESSVARVLAIDDATIHSLCNRYGPGSKKERAQLADRLIARRDDLGKQFPGASKFLE